MFDLRIIGIQKDVFKDAVKSVRLDGTDTEFEILSFHANLAAVLRKGQIVIDGKKKVSILRGLVSFYDNRCTILVEEDAEKRVSKKKK